MQKMVSFNCMILLLIFGSFKTDFTSTHSDPCDSIPVMNAAIIEYAQSKIGKKVGRGECWDFPAEALRLQNAKWDQRFIFGQRVYPDKDCIYPGDIMQFEGVVVEYTKGNMRMQERMGPHTAIIYKVNGPGDYELAHQNFGPAGRKVGITDLQLKNIKKGKYYIYRPEQ